MKYVAWVLGIILVPLVLFSVIQYFASERVEVIELETMESTGEPVITRLWIVDHEGRQYLRVGADGSGWYSRILANPNIKVTRKGTTSSYVAAADTSKSDVLNQLMQEKYTWGDTFIGAVFGRENAIAIELVPIN